MRKHTYNNNVKFIRNEFKNYYMDKGPENGRLQGMKYAGAATHARNCLATLVLMLEPENILEIGSFHYEAADAMADALDKTGSKGVVDSFDIKIGGYDGDFARKPKNNRVRQGWWYPFKTGYDEWKYNDPGIVYPQFKDMTDDQIREANKNILIQRTASFKTYDLIFIDGDHSYAGVKEDYDLAVQFAHKDTVIVLDNVWDQRLAEVRRFYDDLKVEKWDFEEWNDENYKSNMVMDNAVMQKAGT